MQKATGKANGDVLTLSGDADHSSTVSLTSAYNTFTVQSDSDVKHTINGTANPFYNITENGNYTINLSNLNLRGSGQFISDWAKGGVDLTLNADNVSYSSFSNGVIWSWGNVQFSSGTFTFQDNQSQEHAGGGAIMVYGNLTFSGSTATFIGNRTEGRAGGAISVYDENVQFLSGTFTFQNNQCPEAGGAIGAWSDSDLTFSGSTATFIGNRSEWGGGAIGFLHGRGGVHFSDGTYIFQDNVATKWGGAISFLAFEDGECTFSGDGTTATFKGNMAGQFGNDIDCVNLSFTDRGKYSFDGGIYVRDFYSNTSINQAQVTIAGRQFRPDNPTVEDTTNNYDFSNATISNGGTLTANMDYINRLIGAFTLSGAESLITMNKGSDTATIKSSTGNGVADLNFTSDVETISISSGRIDVKGAMSASIDLQNDATFSPGNSVGTLDLDGDFIAYSGILLFEQDATGMDKLIANSYTIGNGVQLQLVFDAPLSEDTYTMYDIIIANNGFTAEQGNVSFWEGLLTDALPEGMIMSVVNGNTVRLEIGPKPVPEPTTWALLVLGVTGLLYVRKRKN